MKITKLRKLHSTFALYFGIIFAFYALSGIVLNHRELLSSISIPRKILPSNYRLSTWNQGSVRGSVNISDKQILIYGNSGIWKYDKILHNFTSFNQGLPKGIDYRKIYSLIQTTNNQLMAGTEGGLYLHHHKKWTPIHLKIHNKRIYNLQQVNNNVFFVNRNNLYSFSLNDNLLTPKITKHVIIPPEDYRNNLSLFRTLWFIHSGEIFGVPGKLFVDFLSLILIFFILTGFFLYFYKLIKKKKIFNLKLTRQKTVIRNYHLKLGGIFFLFLMVSTITGSFLRPPFLILINNFSLPKIPGTHFYNDNPWFDKLRGFHYDKNTQTYFVFTGRGDIYTSTSLSESFHKEEKTPPISIMGINHFSRFNNEEYLVGSFSGLFLWNKKTDIIKDYFTDKIYIPPQGMAPPVSKNLISGIIKDRQSLISFDYSRGSKLFNNGHMPSLIKDAFPMSLWNLALEIHTGRIFSQYLGPFFLLYVPFSGIILILILLFGYQLWRKAYKKKLFQDL